MKKLALLLMCVLAGIFLIQCTPDQKSKTGKDLAKNFVNPPDDAQIWVYWFWLNSNITREGITADLKAMKRVGVGGVLIMEVDQGAPVGPVPFMGDKWRELFKYMVKEASRLGIEVNMNNDAGWNGSGGPWVPLEKAMQVVVTSETRIAGGKKFQGVLPIPPAEEGFYRDIAVLAFPTPKDPDNPSYRIQGLSGKNMSWGTNQEQTGRAVHPQVIPPESVVARDKILDLTGFIDSSGNLAWDAPVAGSQSGEWTVIRFGHTFTGRKNHPAPLSGMGPECDKLSREGVEANYNGMMAKLVQDVGPLAGKTLTATHVDSWEVGAQNWTPKMREEFSRLRGYDMLPFMPVLTGRIVDNAEISERFLRDVRQTVSDLLAENYIGHLREMANKDGLRLSMEAYTAPANDLDVGNHVDEPIAEFWWPGGGGLYWSLKAMSSLAHVNGHAITGAEAFTADDGERWRAHPATIKSLGDKAFCDGINRFIVHRYALQPWVEERKPGMTMGPWGLHYERSNSWWEDSKAWHEYVARCQYMLRQGTFVADVLSLQSEEPMKRFQTLKLNGYDYDGISPQAFLREVTVTDGLLSLPSGMKYRLLCLPEDQGMSSQMLEKIKTLVEAGAVIAGKPPVKSAGLSGWPESDQKIKSLAQHLWGDGTESVRTVGKGQVFTGMKPGEVLAAIGVQPDFLASRSLRYIHRSVDGNEIYFVSSSDLQTTDAVCSFRLTGMVPEAWDPVTGLITPIAVFDESSGRTGIPLNFGPSGSVFIVFRVGEVNPPDQIVSVKMDGRELVKLNWIDTAVKPVDASDSFTMAAWVKPDVDIALPAEADSGVNALNVERNDVVYAAPGHEVWSDKDAGAGFSVGRNGVCVSEHSASYFPALLTYPANLAGWNHVAVVYSNGTPSLFLNGELVHKGLKSKYKVHGGYGVSHERSVTPFKGQVAGLAQFAKALPEEEITKLSLLRPSVPDIQPGPAFDFVSGEILQKGIFEIRTADGQTSRVEAAGLPEPLTIGGSWEVRFTPGWGAPEKLVLDSLISWSQSTDEGVKYFSGSATYHKVFDYQPSRTSGSDLRGSVYLDLGRVEVMAAVKLNGKDQGLLWKPPYRVEITNAVKTGKNILEIRVVNLMINRMIGDEQLPDDSERNENGTLKKWPQWLLDGKPSPAGRYTFTSWRMWKKDSPLQESGLIGPVRILTFATTDSR